MKFEYQYISLKVFFALKYKYAFTLLLSHLKSKDLRK